MGVPGAGRGYFICYSICRIAQGVFPFTKCQVKYHKKRDEIPTHAMALTRRPFEMSIQFLDPLFIPLFRRNLRAHKAARTPERCREHSTVGK